MSRLLTIRRHEVSAAETLAQAKHFCADAKFDLMICDIGLPDGDGWELARVAQQHNTPAIALTAFGMPDEVARGKELGFSAYLLKPVDFAKLNEAIANAVSTSPNA